MSFGGGGGGSGSIHTSTDVALSNPTDGQVLTYSASLQKWQNAVAAVATDATSSSKGVVQLAGDLDGTAASPGVAKIQGIAVSATAPANAGQVLTSTSTTAAAWSTPTAASVTSVFTRTGDVVATTGDYTAAQVGALSITNNLSDVASASVALSNLGATAALTTTAVKTTSYSAAVNQLIPADATSGALTITLPTTPADKTRVIIKKIDSTTNVVTVAAGGSDVFNKASGNVTASLYLQNQALTLQYASSSGIWYVSADDLPLSQLDTRYPLNTATPAGDLSGTYAAPTVAKINGVAIGGTAANRLVLGATSSSAASWVNHSSDWINVLDYGANPNNTGDSTTAFNNAIAACIPGGTVYVPAGLYRITNAINMVANITLRGPIGTRYTGYTGFPAYIKPLSGSFTGNELINATEVSGWHIESLNLYGLGASTTNTSGNPINGIGVYGQCKGVRLDDVMVSQFSGDGIHTDTTSNGWSGGWEVTNLYANGNSYGWRSLNTGTASTYSFSDSKIICSEASVNRNDGWHFEGVTNLIMSELFACFNTGNGYYHSVTAINTVYSACATDRNNMNGWYSSCSEAGAGAPGPHVIIFNGCIASRDGNNNGTTQGGYAGFYFAGTSTAVPHFAVILSGCQTHVAKNDDNSGIWSPDYGVYVTNGKPNGTALSACFFVATVATLYDNNESVIEDPSNIHSLVSYSTGSVNYNYLAPKNAPFTKTKPADTSITSSTTTTDDPDLTYNVIANATYRFEGQIIYDASTTSDIKIGFGGPTGATCTWNGPLAPTSATTTSYTPNYAVQAINNPVATGAAGVGTEILIPVQGLLTIGSTAGTFRLRWAQNTSDASACTVRAGSNLTLTRIA